MSLAGLEAAVAGDLPGQVVTVRCPSSVVQRWPRWPCPVWLILPMVVAMFACVQVPRSLRAHVVMYDGEGGPVDPAQNHAFAWLSSYDTVTEAEDLEHLAEVRAGLLDYLQRPCPRDRELVIFVHGGLNT